MDATRESVDGPIDGLQLVERARGQVWLAAFSGWTTYAGAVVLVSFGLVDDYAPDWAAVYFTVVGLLGLVIGLSRYTRRGRALFRLPAMPRSAVLGTGHRGTRGSQALLVALWVAAIALMVVTFVGSSAARGGNGQPSDPPVPSTVVFTALALALLGIDLAVRRWAQRKIDGHARS